MSYKSDSDSSDTIFGTTLSNTKHLYSTAANNTDAGSRPFEVDLLSFACISRRRNLCYNKDHDIVVKRAFPSRLQKLYDQRLNLSGQ